MNKYDTYEEWAVEIKKNTPVIPKLITEKWLEEQLLNRKSYFRNWGFCFENLEGHKFEENIDHRIIRKVPFSTKTIFPQKNPFNHNNSIFCVDDNIKLLHNEGIDGTGINIAVIDFCFNIIPQELEECLYSYKNYSKSTEPHFHGTIVSTQICGKNLGVAPKAKLWFYGTGQGEKNIIPDSIEALKDIYNQNKKGANIKIINISGSRHTQNPEYNNLIQKLLLQGCIIIDSPTFAENFTSINKDPNTQCYYYSDWQLSHMKRAELLSKITVPTGGKMTPLITTKNDYLYCGQATYSWSIPIISGYFALALQVNPDLTYDQFVELAYKTKAEQDGIKIFNINGVIEQLKRNKSIKR